MNFKKNKETVKKEYCLIGLSKFGYCVAQVLKNEKQQVTVVDKNKDTIDTLGGEFKHAAVCDATNLKKLEELGLYHFDCVVVGVQNIEKSITICSNLKELKVKKIMAITKNVIHQKILRNMGIPITVIPEIEVAEKMAYQIMFDLNIELFSFDSVVKNVFIIRVPAFNQELWEKNISELTFLKNLSATIISIKRNNGDIIVPVSGNDQIKRNDKVCIICQKDSVKALKEYFFKNLNLLKE